MNDSPYPRFRCFISPIFFLAWFFASLCHTSHSSVMDHSKSTPHQSLEKIAENSPALDQYFWRDVLNRDEGDEPIIASIFCTDPDKIRRHFSKNFIRDFKPFGLSIVVCIVDEAQMLVKVSATSGVLWVTSAFGASMNLPDVSFPDGPLPDAQPVDVNSLHMLPDVEVAKVHRDLESDRSLADFFDVGPGHGAACDTNGDGVAPWDKGIMGNDVLVAVVDDGIDFGHPDLQKTWAVYPSKNAPDQSIDPVTMAMYGGRPYCFSPTSLLLYASDLNLDTNFVKWAYATWFCDTSETPSPTHRGDHVELSYAPFVGSGSATRRGPFIYTAPKSSKSGVYRMGTHPDSNLFSIYRHKVAVLLVDENEPGVYDTVYTDIDNNFDFRNDKPCRYNDPLTTLDRTGDNVADLSAGIVAFIADGSTPLPMSWLYGEDVIPPPPNGSLVVFDGAFDNGYSHGTQIASNIAGQGVTATGVPSFADWTDDQPVAALQGIAPNSRLINVSNVYRSGSGFFDAYLFCAYGFDGVPDSGDEPQIANLSFGYPDTINVGMDFQSRFIQAIETQLAPRLSIVHSSGNAGPGFATVRGPIPLNGLNVGASTTYGSTGWDSLRDTTQIESGDIANFSSRGPDGLGRPGVDLCADGAYAAGAQSLNYYLPQTGFTFDGRFSWNTWGGTSRAAPVAAGALALVYQSWKQRTGRFPTASEASAIMMAGARFAWQEPYTQGAGVLDCDNAVDMAIGEWGIGANPSRWTPGAALDTVAGDSLAARYPSFPSALFPGQIATEVFNLTNYGTTDVEAQVSAIRMEYISQFEFAIPINRDHESPYHFMIPDYLHPLPFDQIPPDADLMVIRILHDFDAFDHDASYFSDERWFVTLLNWTDHNGDGLLWNDENGNGVVNHETTSGFYNIDRFPAIDWNESEMQPGEFVRLDYSKLNATTHELAVRNPAERMKDGYFIGLHHRLRFGTRDNYALRGRMEFYKMSPWNWVSFPSGNSMNIPAEEAMPIAIELQAPLATPPGSYGGFIKISMPESGGRNAHAAHIPVNANVAVHLYETRSHVLGGGQNEDKPGLHRNDLVRGLFNWEWRRDSGDQRTFYLDMDTSLTSGSVTAIRTRWDDKATTVTDLDVHWLAPERDYFTGVADAQSPGHPHFQANPAVFGPYGLQLAARSQYTNQGAGTWKFQTTSGGNEEWLLYQPSAGFHQVRIQNVLHSGKMFETPFETEMIHFNLLPFVNPRYVVTPSGSMPLSLFSSRDMTDLNATVFGPGSVIETIEYVSDDPDNNNSTDVFDPDRGWWFRDFKLMRPFRLSAALTLDDNAPDDIPLDLDLLIYFDADNDGITTHPKELIAVSLSSESDELIELQGDLKDGLYRVAVYGFQGGAPFRLKTELVEGSGYETLGLNGTSLQSGIPTGFSLKYADIKAWPEQNPGALVLSDENGQPMVLFDFNLIRPALTLDIVPDRPVISPNEPSTLSIIAGNGSPWPLDVSIKVSFPEEMTIVNGNQKHSNLVRTDGLITFNERIPAHATLRNEFAVITNKNVIPGSNLPVMVSLDDGSGTMLTKNVEFVASDWRGTFDDQDAWNFSTLPGVFTEATGKRDTGRLVIESLDNQSFGSWNSASNEVYLASTGLYRIRVRAGSNVSPSSLAPDIRFRFNDNDTRQSDMMLITANGGGLIAPNESGITYDMFSMARPDHRSGSLAFDMLNLDPARAASGQVFLDEYDVSILSIDASDWKLERVYDFDHSPEGWQFSGKVPPFQAALGEHSAGALSLQATSNADCFGSWFVVADDISFAPNRLYHLRFHISSSEIDFTRTPPFRFRAGSSNFAQMHVQSHDPQPGDTSSRWSTYLSTGFSIYFIPAPELAKTAGVYPFMGVDLLGFNPNRSANATLFIDRVEILSSSLVLP